MKHLLRTLVGAALCLCAAGAHAQPQLYHNANIYTMNPAKPRAEQMLVQDGIIAAIGSAAEVREAMREQGVRVIQRVDVGGKTIIPGLIDAHGHMISLGAIGLGMLDLRSAASYEDVVNIVRDRASHTPPGTWIVGRGWDNESWTDKRLPHHAALSAAVPDHPVWITRVDGHAGLANARAMELAGVGPATQSPEGGEVLRENGQPTGLFVDNAEGIIGAVIPDGLTGSAEECILKAQEMCLEFGLTGVHDAGVSPQEVEVYQGLESSARLKIRVYGMVHASMAREFFELRGGAIDSFKLSVYAAKAYIDGAMGSRGAWLLEPYADRSAGPDGQPYVGLAVMQPNAIEELARHAIAHNYQLCTHAIGDRGNREVLDAYERALASTPPAGDKPPRFRIEHAQLLDPDDIPRFAALGIIPSMQPTHCTSDMRWVDARVGAQRARGAYAWASLLKSGSRLAFGSDFPVESHNPFLGIYAAVTRTNLDGQPEGGFHPEQRLTREEALRAFTIDAAYAAYWEERVGSLEYAKLADFVILDRDVMTCDVEEIPETKVLKTYSFGELVYEAK
jgi:predicted amidohydrolase YtcJ